MLMSTQLEVVHIDDKNCFAYFNSAFQPSSDFNQCVQLTREDGRTFYLWPIYSTNVQQNNIGLNPLFCKCLDLTHGQRVVLSGYTNALVLDQVFIEPESADDRDILEHNAEILQLQLLDQLRAVGKDQKMIVWVSPSMPIIFTTKQTGILVQHTKLIVKMDYYSNLMSDKPSDSGPPITSNKEEFDHNSIHKVLRTKLSNNNLPPCTLYLRTLVINDTEDSPHTFIVYTHKDNIENTVQETKFILAHVTAMSHTFDINTEEEPTEKRNEVKTIYVEVRVINSSMYIKLCEENFNEHIHTVLVPRTLAKTLKISNGSKMLVTLLNRISEEPIHIELLPLSSNKNKITNECNKELVDKFKKYIIDNTSPERIYVANSGVAVYHKEISSDPFVINIGPNKLKYAVISTDLLRNCEIVYMSNVDMQDQSDPVKYIDKSDSEDDTMNLCNNIKTFSDIISSCLSNLEFEMHRDAYFQGVLEVKGNVLITGTAGSGKTSLCYQMAKRCRCWSYILNCRAMKGRKDISEALARAISMCVKHSPSVLICDDFDSLVLAEVDGAAPHDVAYYSRLAATVRHQILSCVGVRIVLTASSIASLHHDLKDSSGLPLFTTHFEIKELVQEERIGLIQHLISQNVGSEITVSHDNILKMAINTTGSNVRDLVDYVNRRIFNTIKSQCSSKGVDTELILIEEGSEISCSNKKNYDIWAKIGGMTEVKQQLIECVFWPFMYPALFPSQSSGILLFGAPGTGKSYIGSALAQLRNMEFLSVKGPELLSKYIGQSEKAVRDIFDKADMKKPCILFFDEFDSLAPKRGHDSTGVTDRVVNQLLVRLDGAEGGAKGPVIAATSRPDLIDSALLRPGRLDQHIFCPLPDAEDRYSILQTLARTLELVDDVDLENIALRTEGFSPADLKSLLVTAQLTSLEKQLDVSDASGLKVVVVTKDDLESALSETKPSLSEEQRIFYDIIYKKFKGEKLTNRENLMTQYQKQRVTLA